MISAQNGDGIDDFLKTLVPLMPEGPWHFHEDQTTDMSLTLLAAEITREKIYTFLHQELPYAITVETEKWERRKDGSVMIHQVIFVERSSQKAIVLGHKGETLKRIGMASRLDMTAQWDFPVHLKLHVVVSEKWSHQRERYEAMGLTID
jgi:GTP-binding protein Era